MDEIQQDSERQQIEAYMQQYCLEELLDETVNSILESKPTNPYTALARLIEYKAMAEILEVSLASSFGERGRTCVVATVNTNMGSFTGSCGMPLNKFSEDEDMLIDFSEAKEKVDDVLRGLDPRNLKDVDEKICSVASLPRAATVALSIACCRAGAKHRSLPLYRFIAEYAEATEKMRLPVPMATAMVRSAPNHTSPVVPASGATGMPTGGLTLIQDITMTPVSSPSLDNALEQLQVAVNIVKRAAASTKDVSVCVTSPIERGAIHLVTATMEEAFTCISAAMTNNNIKLSLDARGGSFQFTPPPPTDDKPAYVPPADGTMLYLFGVPAAPVALSPRSAAAAAAAPAKNSKDAAAAAAAAAAAEPELPAGTKTSSELADCYVSLFKAHGTMSVEDPFHPKDIAGLKMFKQRVTQAAGDSDHSECPPKLAYAVQEGIGGDSNCHIQIVADACVANSEEMAKYDVENAYDTLKVNIYKIGSVYKAIQLCKSVRQWSIIVGSEEGCAETLDSFVADFAVGIGAGQFAAGGFDSGECLSKYNRLLEINREDDSIPFAGRQFR